MNFIGLVLAIVFLIAKSSSESTEDPVISHIFTTSNNVNFNEIFSNSLASLNDDSVTTIKKQDDDFTLTHMPSQFAEFRPYTTSTTSTSSTTTPPPRFPKASHITKRTRATRVPRTRRTTTTAPPTTTTPSVKVLPLKQRGVLDLLFPAVRVKKFKSIFETVRRMLSYTF
ncbi:uncharacterized protein LOC126375569 isoform X2 [Pectinophora gossypiella]|uniref:uncharacterized protein LOC126375569 isoform X2 n=1 Tax=Pectinophora gossypiella TaxID=13191 RepID=UPI00214E6753|nr:uncharacterized protein LOC126375569 isoform X2 [Pectinophora gossypiella]